MVNKPWMDLYKCPNCLKDHCDWSCINIIKKIKKREYIIKPKIITNEYRCIGCLEEGCNWSCVDILSKHKPKIEEILRFDEKLDFKKLPNLDDLNCISQEKIKLLKDKLNEILWWIDLEKMNESELWWFLKYLWVCVSLLWNDLSIYESIKWKNDFQKNFFEKKVDKLDKILTKQPINFVQEKVIEATSIIKWMINNLDILSWEQIKENGDKLNIIWIDISNYLDLKNIIKKEV